jgi:glycosyltransferase involved in cell wall biosynthesis
LNRSKQHIVYVTSRFPYPIEKGDKLRAYNQIKQLSKQYHVHLFSLVTNEPSAKDYEQINAYCYAIHVFHLNWLGRLSGLFFALFTKKPFQVHYFYNWSVHKRVFKLLETIQPSHIFCQLIRCADYVKDYHNCPKTLDYMDALSKGMERRIQGASWYTRWVIKEEAHRLMNYERRVFDYFENQLIISEQDKLLIAHPDQKHIHVSPNGIDESFLHPTSIEKTVDIVFVGNLGYPPNVEAVEFLVSLRQQCAFTCLIAGAEPSKKVKSLLENQVDFTLAGWVDDIREAYCKAKLFVAPMMIGTGMQNKLLEAMALGIPCITTSLAAYPVGGVHEKNMLIANAKDEFQFAINRLLTDEKLAMQLAQNAQSHVITTYGWDEIGRSLAEILNRSPYESQKV